MDCSTIVHEKVCVEVKITVTPNEDVGDIESFCVGKPKFEPCCKTPDCDYMVSQLVCVPFPLSISAKAKAESTGIVCDKPKMGPCPMIPAPCKHTRVKNINRRNPSFLPLFIFAILCRHCF